MNPYTQRSLSPELGVKITKRRVRALKNWRILTTLIGATGIVAGILIDPGWACLSIVALLAAGVFSFTILENQEDLDVWEDHLAQKKQKEADQILFNADLPMAYSAVLLEQELEELSLRLSRHRRDVDELLEEL